MTTGPATAEQRRAFGEALDEALRAAAVSPGDLANHVKLSDDAVRKWVAGKSEPPPGTVFAVEAFLNLPPGDLSRHLGFVPTGITSVTAAIDNDPDLDPLHRKMVRDVYRSARQARS